MRFFTPWRMLFLLCMPLIIQPSEEMRLRSIGSVPYENKKLVEAQKVDERQQQLGGYAVKTYKTLCCLAILGQGVFAGCGLIKQLLEKYVVYEK